MDSMEGINKELTIKGKIKFLFFIRNSLIQIIMTKLNKKNYGLFVFLNKILEIKVNFWESPT